MAHEMDEKYYTVKQVAHMANVTIKTLHHYDAIGLLHPAQTSNAGYRLYGHNELERLQQILFYRELDIPLAQIKSLLMGATDRTEVLRAQRGQLLQRKEQLQRVIRTIDLSIASAQEGKRMDTQSMFHGFKTEEEWKKAMEPHNKHLKDTLGIDISTDKIDVAAMNESAQEAKQFMDEMAEALRNKIPCDDAAVKAKVKEHLAFTAAHGHKSSPQDFAKQTQFFLQDDFHRHMLEDQQIGLAYYLHAVANTYGTPAHN